MIEELRSALYKICKNLELSDKTILSNDLDSILDRNPYIPFIPDNWNGFLAIAEAQQLRGNSTGNVKFVDDIKAQGLEGLIYRLYSEVNTNGKVGITPWDDGHIKLAVKSCFPEINLNDVGIANAVPWHLNKTNKLQSAYLKDMSVLYWNLVLEILKKEGLKCIIRTGEYARTILDYKKLKEMGIPEIYRLRSASQLSRVIDLFDTDDLLHRYPEVKNALDTVNVPSDADRKTCIFYAAHAVSTIRKKHNITV